MTLVSLMSPPHSPGTTTTALALTYAWPHRAVLAECNPEGSSVETGYMRDQVTPARGGLLPLALAIAHNPSPNPSVLGEHLIEPIPTGRERQVLLGLRDPLHAAQLRGAWDTITDVLMEGTEGAADVIADVGTLGHFDTPGPLIARSGMALMVLRPTLRQVAAAKPRLEALVRWLDGEPPVRLCLIGRGDYNGKEIMHALAKSSTLAEADIRVIAELPHDPRSAALLADGTQKRRWFTRISPLMSHAAVLANAICAELSGKEAPADTLERELKEVAI